MTLMGDSHAARPQPSPAGPQTSALISAIHRLSAAHSIAEIMEIVTKAVRLLLGADGATFVLRDGDRCFYAEEDAISPLWKGQRFPLTACISGWCMLHDRPVKVPDIFKDDRIPVDAYRPTFVRSLAMAPIGREDPIAALGAYWSVVREITDEDVLMLGTIADAAELAVAYVQLQRTGGATASPTRPRSGPIADPEPDPTAPAASPQDWWRRVRRKGLNQRGWEAYGFGVICALVATSFQLGVDQLGAKGLMPFVSYFPAVLLSILVAGPRAAILTSALGAVLGAWALMGPRFGAGLSPAEVIDIALFCGACALMILTVQRHRSALRRLAAEEARHLTLAREQRHRLENAIQVVETIVRRSLTGDELEARSINERIRAGLANLHIQPRDAKDPIAIQALLDEKLRPFDRDRFKLLGDGGLELGPKTRSLIGFAVHELATNALKHGALSASGGFVSIGWTVEGERFAFTWTETGGPPVQPPTSHGYGLTLLHRLVQAERGAIRMEFAPAGLTVEVSLKADRRERRERLRLNPLSSRRSGQGAAQPTA